MDKKFQLVPFGFQTAGDHLFLGPVLWILDLLSQANMSKQITFNELLNIDRTYLY